MKRYYSNMPSILQLKPKDFVDDLKKNTKQRRYYIYFDPAHKKLMVSHPYLQPIASYIEKDRDYLGHEGLFFEVGLTTGVLFGAFLQKTKRGQGQGGVRLWNYTTAEHFLRDGMRLATGMGRKSALAGLWWGGGKGIVCDMNGDFSDPTFRKNVFNEYGSFLTGLRGAYYGAEDVGTTTKDCTHIMENTRFVTCIPQTIGGSGNPSIQTAVGVVCAMEAALNFKKMGTLEGKTITMQGSGNVARHMMIELLKKKVKKIIATDINPENISHAKKVANYPNVDIRLVESSDLNIFKEKADIFAPNALGAILNETTIPLLNAPIICGAANNQLKLEKDGEKIKDRNILYIPDYVCNRMGIVNCANENYGYVDNDYAILRHYDTKWENSIFNITTAVLQKSKDENISTNEAANRIADRYAELEHPIWGHRTKYIIKSLVDGKWNEKTLI